MEEEVEGDEGAIYGITHKLKIIKEVVGLAETRGDPLQMRAIEFIWERLEGKVPTKIDIEARVRAVALAEGLDPDEAVDTAMRILSSSYAS
jgi:hypothetical protein